MNNINCTCPHCSHTMQLAETLIGQQGKCPACGQTITVQQSLGTPPVGTPPVGTSPLGTPPLGTPPLPSGSPAQPEISTKDAALALTSAAGTTAKKLFGQVTDSLRPMDSTSDGNNRYPNLSKYLALSETLIKVVYIVSLVLLILGVVGGILVGVFGIFQEGVFFGVGVMLGAIIVGAFYFLFLWLWRMMALAMTELLRVFMDIEINTRQR